MALSGLSPMPPQRKGTTIIPQDVPVYRIGAGKFFGPDDTPYDAGDIMEFDGEPNPDFEPLNDKAEERMKAYLQKLDDEGRKAAEKAGKNYTSLADAWETSIELERENSKQVRLLNGRKEAPLMGAKKNLKTRIGKLDLGDVSEADIKSVRKAAPETGRLSLKKDEKA